MTCGSVVAQLQMTLSMIVQPAIKSDTWYTTYTCTNRKVESVQNYSHAFSQNVRRIIPYVHAMDVSRFYVMGVTLARITDSMKYTINRSRFTMDIQVLNQAYYCCFQEEHKISK